MEGIMNGIDAARRRIRVLIVGRRDPGKRLDRMPARGTRSTENRERNDRSASGSRPGVPRAPHPTIGSVVGAAILASGLVGIDWVPGGEPATARADCGAGY